MTRFKIEAKPVGGRLAVDGEDVSDHVRGVTVQLGVDQPTRVIVELRPGADGVLTGDGVVEVVRNGIVGEAVAAWLDKIDGATLSRAALDRDGGLEGPDPVEQALKILKEWARGTPGRS